MELPSRARGDILLPPGEMGRVCDSLRRLSARHDLVSVIACAFDHRTRILPFIYADMKMVPAGVRAIGSALVAAGFPKTRIVLQQWNRNFRPAQMRLDGRVPDLFLVSTMHLHGDACDQMIQDACRIEPARRPLIIAGGPRIVYEPWHVFRGPERAAREHQGVPGTTGLGARRPTRGESAATGSADVAVTGEEYVLLQLLEVLLSLRSPHETLRNAFLRARDCGALDEVPGLVYGRGGRDECPVEELIDTGTQRLLGDLDELPSAVHGYGLLEPPSRDATLSAAALPARRVRRHSPISSIVLTMGCKFRCSYCPIPAYNQRQHRVKSGERVADEMGQIAHTYGIHSFFGTDDNFFNDAGKTLDITEALARRVRTRQRPWCKLRWGTEVTVHDTLRMREHLPSIREAGLLAVWMGVEDLTGTLVKKGQSESKTLESFHVLRQAGIFPVPMMMHHDTQPLVTWRNNYGLVNQLRTLRKSGALYTQVLMLTPAPGSRWYEDTYASGLAFEKVGGEPIPNWRGDGNYVVASKHPRPWLKQLNLLAGYTYFFNPLRLLLALVWSRSHLPLMAAETRPAEELRGLTTWQRFWRRAYLGTRAHLVDAAIQGIGMIGLFHTYRRTGVWAWRLLTRKIERYSTAPVSRIPMRGAGGQPASHALPGTPTLELTPLVLPAANGPRADAA